MLRNIDIETKKIKDVYIQPGGIYTSEANFTAITALGSCISICMLDAKLGYGGINHYMMPYWAGDGLATPKYGNVAIEKLIERFVCMGSDKKDLISKVFGGVDARDSSSVFSIGKSNAEIAMEILSNHRIKIACADVGGNQGRKIMFDSCTGKVRVKYINLITRRDLT